MDFRKSLASSVQGLENILKHSKIKELKTDSFSKSVLGYCVLTGILNSSHSDVREEKYTSLLKELELCVRSLDGINRLLYSGTFNLQFRKPFEKSFGSKLSSNSRRQSAYVMEGTLQKAVYDIVSSDNFLASALDYLRIIGNDVYLKIKEDAKNTDGNRVSHDFIGEYEAIYSAIMKMYYDIYDPKRHFDKSRC